MRPEATLPVELRPDLNVAAGDVIGALAALILDRARRAVAARQRPALSHTLDPRGGPDLARVKEDFGFREEEKS